VKLLSLLFVLSILTSCAVPPAAIDTAGFVQSRELQTAGLVREGLQYLDQGRYIDAELSFGQALYLFPTADNVQENLAIALIGSGQLREAESILQELVRKYPKAARLHNRLGELYYSDYRYSESLAALTRALSISFSRREYAAAAGTLRSMASLAEQRGLGEDAVCYSAEALSLKQEGRELIGHARILVSEHRYQEVMALPATILGGATELRMEWQRLTTMAMYAIGKWEAVWRNATEVLERRDGALSVRDEFELMRVLAEHKIGRIDAASAAQQLKELALVKRGPTQKQTLLWPPSILQDLAGLIGPEIELGGN
jgi:tetratricopeptide (TPR) repeat protein